MAKKLYVGNLPFSATEDELRSMFEEHGAVASVNVITDRETGRARGFAFVEMNEAGDADKAMQALDGKDMGGRSLRVAAFLRQQGFDQAQSMAGGIDEWSQTIDPAIPRY